LYDDDNLYVGVNMWDKDIERRVVNELKEDYAFRDTDGVSVVLDTLGDNRSGFTFGTNPAGARRDGQLFNDGGLNQDWDGVWDVKVSIDERRFNITYRPLSDIYVVYNDRRNTQIEEPLDRAFIVKVTKLFSF
jgi:hypothetical protein